MSRHNALSMNDLSLSFGGFQVLNSLSLQVEEGETLGLIGPNGSGKTTLFNVISGFLSLKEGSISLFDQPITSLPPHKRARAGIGRVFQNFGIFRELTVFENLLAAEDGKLPWYEQFVPRMRSRKGLKQKFLKELSRIGLEEKLYEKAASLSGGQLRLLEILRASLSGAKLFLLDEPTAGVAPKMKGQVVSLIRDLKDRGHTILVIEHDVRFLESFCDRIAVLDQGRIVMEGAPTEVRSDKRLQEIYFGSDESDGEPSSAPESSSSSR